MSDDHGDEPPTETTELKVGDVVDGRYRVARRLGRGGMGTVYEALQVKLQRSVALKVLRPEFATKELAVKRFEREARAASSIDHRNVVKILDFGHLESGEVYYTMELLHGRDLHEVLREQGALPWSRAGWIILQVVRAFAAIHEKGIVHRDIKPANCFLVDPKPGDEPDYVKVLDFGIANLQDKDKATALTAASDIIGSVRYMAPEQAAADEVDARTDIYSLGIMMYELLTGQVPFRETNVFKVMVQHQQEAPRPLHELVPEIPEEIEAIVLRALAKQPDARFQSMAEIEGALLPWIDSLPASGVVRATSPADRPLSPPGLATATTSAGPTGTVALSAASQGGTAAGDHDADTTPIVGGSMPLASKPRPGRARAIGAQILVVVVVFAASIGATLWVMKARPSTEVATTEADADANPTPSAAESADPPAEPGPSQLAPPPPEQQYDPFADPFGAPPLRGRTGSHAAPRGTGRGHGPQPHGESVPLEDLLPPEPWTLPPGSIAGRLLNDQRRPVAKGRACAWIIDPRAPVDLRRKPRCGQADSQGRFEIRGVAPGFYDLNAFAPGFVPQSLLEREGYPLTVRPEQRSEEVLLTLAKGGAELRGTVTTTGGQAVPSASVATLGALRSLAVTDATGAFSLWVAEGDVRVVAWATGYTDVVTSGRASVPLTLVLRRESVLVGRVIDQDTHEPIGGARVRAGAQGTGVDPLVYTNVDGEFRISALSAGAYEPVARTDDAFGRATKPVEIPEGMISAEVVIEARRVASVPTPRLPEPAVVADEVTPESTGDALLVAGADTTGPEDGPSAEQADGETPSSVPKAAPTDRSLRKALALKLKRCGSNGTIEITAKYVLDTGMLFQPAVRITGAAAKEPTVKACAERLIRTFALRRRKEVSSFSPLVVDI